MQKTITITMPHVLQHSATDALCTVLLTLEVFGFRPFVFERNLRVKQSMLGSSFTCQTVNVNTREERHWPHTWQRFKRSKAVKLNSIVESKIPSKNPRTVQYPKAEMSVNPAALHCGGQFLGLQWCGRVQGWWQSS
jgi:hypothetical protein